MAVMVEYGNRRRTPPAPDHQAPGRCNMASKHSTLTAERLRELLHYEAGDGRIHTPRGALQFRQGWRRGRCARPVPPQALPTAMGGWEALLRPPARVDCT